MSYKRNIWLFHLASFVSNFELIASLFVLFLLSHDLSMTQVMILQSVFTLSILSFEIPSGIFADLFGLKKTLILSNLMMGSGFIIYALSDSFWPFLFGEIMVGVAISLYSGTSGAFLFDSLKEINEEKRFQKELSKNYALSTIAFGSASIIGGLMARHYDLGFIYLVSAIGYFSAIFIMIFYKEPTSFKKVGDIHFIKHFKESMILSKNFKLKKLIFYYSFFGAFSYFLFYLIQPYIALFNLDYFYIGLIVGAYFFILALGNYVGRFKIKNILIYSIFLFSIFLILVQFVPFYLGIIFILLANFVGAIKEIVVENEFNHLATSSHRATMISIRNMIMNIVFTIVSPFLGVIADFWDVRTSFMMMGIILMIFAFVWLSIYYFIKK